MVKQPSTDEFGESIEGPSKTVRFESDGNGRAGDAVTIAAGQVTPVAAVDDDVLGILFKDAPAAGERVAVQIMGVVVARAAAAITAGTTLDPDGAAAGELVENAQGMSHNVDEGGTAIYRLSPANPVAVTDAAAGEPVGVYLR